MDTQYTVEIQEFIITRPWPKGFLYNVYENERTLTIVMYKDNLASLSGEDIERIKRILLTDIRDLNFRGVTIEPAVEEHYE